VRDAAHAYRRARELGAWPVEPRVGPMELSIPAIKGIGDSLIYLVDRYGPEHSIYDVDFIPAGPGPRAAAAHPPSLASGSLRASLAGHRGVGLTYVDHLTHNVHRGRMQEWADFYARLFGFRQIRYFDIEGRVTGLHSKAMVSPCGKIRIPINESADDRSQIQEYLTAYRGEGIQHIALATEDIHGSVEQLRDRGIRLMETPDTYYDALQARVPGHEESVERLRKDRILLDGSASEGFLLQIFTETVIGPIFFEIIQRKGNEGFGEGNFQALFEAIERDQIARGTLPS
jgi:4-hydroxyphenylpyruvate dioxygenase